MNPTFERILNADPYPFFDEETDGLSLLSLREAVLRTEEQIKEHADYQKLLNEARIFYAEMLLAVFRRKHEDYSDPLLKDHYDFVHEFFRSSLYESFNRNSVAFVQIDTFLWFLRSCLRQHS